MESFVPYLADVRAEQIAARPSAATIRVHWTLGDLPTDVIEIRLQGDTATPPTLLASVVVQDGTPEFFDIELPAPNVVLIVVSPRTLEGDSLTDQMPDDSGEPAYWETFSMTLAPLTLAPGP
jgi:hypothetical protein